MDRVAVTSTSRAIDDVAHVALMFPCWQLLCFSSTVWVYHVARHLPAGSVRGLACLPAVVVLLGAAPLLIDRCRVPLVIIPLTLICSLSAFKIAAFAIGRGPLAHEASEWCKCMKKFHIVLSFPIIPVAAFNKPREDRSAGAVCIQSSSGQAVGHTSPNSNSNGYTAAPASEKATATAYLTVPAATSKQHSSVTKTQDTCKIPSSPTNLSSYLRSAAWQVPSLALAVHISQDWTFLPLPLRHWFYALLLALELQVICDFYGMLSAVCFGLKAARSFDKPWMSASVAEYWSKRWNLPTTYMLRVLIYDPIIEGCLVPRHIRTRQAMTATAVPATAAAAAAVAVAVYEQPVSASSSPGKQQPTAEAAAEGVVDMLRTDSNDSDNLSEGSAESSASNACGVAVTAAEPAASCRMSLLTAASNKSNSSSGGGGLVEGPSFLKAWMSTDKGAAVAAAPAAAMKQQSLNSKSCRPSNFRRLLGVQASFVLSGAWHTLMFYYASGHWIWHWLVFFSLQAPALAAEQAVKQAAIKHGVRMPKFGALVLTNAVILVFGTTLFCRPIDSLGLNQAFYNNALGRVAGSPWESQCSEGGAYYW